MSKSGRTEKVVTSDNEGEDEFSFSSPSRRKRSSRIAGLVRLAKGEASNSTSSKSVPDTYIPQISELFDGTDDFVEDGIQNSAKAGAKKSAGQKRKRAAATAPIKKEKKTLTKEKKSGAAVKKKAGTKLPLAEDADPEEDDGEEMLSNTKFSSKSGKVDWESIFKAWDEHIGPVEDSSRVEELYYYPEKAVRAFLEACKRPTRLLDLVKLSGDKRILEASRVSQLAFASDVDTRLRLAAAIAKLFQNKYVFADTEIELGARAQEAREAGRIQNLEPHFGPEEIKFPQSQASLQARVAVDAAVEDAISGCAKTGIGSGRGKKALLQGGKDREVKGESMGGTLGGFLRVVTQCMEAGGHFAGMSLTVGPRHGWLKNVRKVPICGLSEDERKRYLALTEENARLLSPLGYYVQEEQGLTLTAFQNEITSERRDKIIDDFVDLPKETVEEFRRKSIQLLFSHVEALVGLDKETRANVHQRAALGEEFPLTTTVAAQVSYSFAIPIPPLISFEKLSELLMGMELGKENQSVEFAIACARALKSFAPSFTPRIRLTGQRAGSSEFIPVADVNSRYLTVTFTPSVSSAAGAGMSLPPDVPAAKPIDLNLRTSEQVEKVIQERVSEGLKGIVESLDNRKKLDGTTPLSLESLDELPGLVKVFWLTKVHEVQSSELEYLSGMKSRPVTENDVVLAEKFDVNRDEGPIHKEKRGRKPGPIEMTWRVEGLKSRPSKRAPKSDPPHAEETPVQPAQSPPRPAILQGILKKIAKTPASPSQPILGSVLRTMSTSLGSPSRD